MCEAITIQYFVFFIFVVRTNHENIFTTKISRSTVCKHVNQLRKGDTTGRRKSA